MSQMFFVKIVGGVIYSGDARSRKRLTARLIKPAIPIDQCPVKLQTSRTERSASFCRVTDIAAMKVGLTNLMIAMKGRSRSAPSP